MHRVPTSVSVRYWKSAQSRMMRGTPVRGKLRKMTLRYDLSPVLRPCQKGEEEDRQRRCGMK